jgi:hypothetical protein
MEVYGPDDCVKNSLNGSPHLRFPKKQISRTRAGVYKPRIILGK